MFHPFIQAPVIVAIALLAIQPVNIRASEATAQPPHNSKPAAKLKPSVLARLANGLAPGKHADAPELKNPHSNNLDIQWMTICAYYDAKHEEIQYMGKYASGQDPTGRFHHYVYAEATHTWHRTSPGSLRGNGTTGHIWNTAFDFETGDYYIQCYGRKHLCRFDRAKWVAAGKPEGIPAPKDRKKRDPYPVPDWWSFRTAEGKILFTTTPNLNGMAVHPNLFGKGDKGVVCGSQDFLWGYRIADNTWQVLSRRFIKEKGIGGGQSGGAGWYVPKADSAVVGGHVMWRVPAGADGKHPANAQHGAKTPILVKGGGGNKGGYGKQIQDPTDVNRLMIMEVGGESRVWASADLGQSWTLQSFKHPFNEMRAGWTACSIPRYGVILGLKSTRGFLARLWKVPPVKFE